MTIRTGQRWNAVSFVNAWDFSPALRVQRTQTDKKRFINVTLPCRGIPADPLTFAADEEVISTERRVSSTPIKPGEDDHFKNDLEPLDAVNRDGLPHLRPSGW